MNGGTDESGLEVLEDRKPAAPTMYRLPCAKTGFQIYFRVIFIWFEVFSKFPGNQKVQCSYSAINCWRVEKKGTETETLSIQFELNKNILILSNSCVFISFSVILEAQKTALDHKMQNLCMSPLLLPFLLQVFCSHLARYCDLDKEMKHDVEHHMFSI